MYPSWPLIENLWVSARRSSGSLRRTGRSATTTLGATAGAGVSAALPPSFLVDSGWLRLQLSR